MSYNKSLSIFSPTGTISQIEYAGEAVKQGLCAVGVKGKETVVIAVEKKAVQKLQDGRTVRKIYKLDDHAFAAFAGLSADARVLVHKVQLQCQSFRLNYEDRMEVDFIVRHLAELQQKSTQSGGRRPYGVSTIVGGFNNDGTPQLWITEPSGMHAAWKACAIGGKSKLVLDSLETLYKPDMSRDECISTCIRALLEVVDSGARNVELIVLTKDSAETVPEEVIAQLSARLEEEREAERARKRAALADD